MPARFYTQDKWAPEILLIYESEKRFLPAINAHAC